ncbi:MAG TPA: M48 family metalloprotease [Acidimicrobiales bacterium]|nr:M48 family metalloprotease [Acidimicrobiales bacterium]
MPGDSEAPHRNRRRARAIATLPGVVVFGIIALVLSGLGEPIVGLVAGAAAGALASVALWLGATSLVLRSLHAERAGAQDLPRAQNLVEGLCATMGLPLPAMWVVHDEARDALALGRGHRTASLVLTSGLVSALDPVALEGLLAHELTHVKRCDIAPATVAAALLLPFAPFVPGIGAAVHRIAGRGREFHTDRLAVSVTRYPPGLRGALAGIVDGPRPGPRSVLYSSAGSRATCWLWTVAFPEWVGAEQRIGELDAAEVRISALDQW